MGYIHTIPGPYSNVSFCTLAITRNNFYNEIEMALEGFDITWNGFGCVMASVQHGITKKWYFLILDWFVMNNVILNNCRMTFQWIGNRNDMHGMEWLRKYVLTRDYFWMEWDWDALDYPIKQKISETPTTDLVCSLRLASHWLPCMPPIIVW